MSTVDLSALHRCPLTCLTVYGAPSVESLFAGVASLSRLRRLKISAHVRVGAPDEKKGRGDLEDAALAHILRWHKTLNSVTIMGCSTRVGHMLEYLGRSELR